MGEVILRVPAGVLAAAQADWDAAADRLDGAWHRLGKASTAGFSTEVATAAQEFLDTWVDEVKARARDAQGHSDAIRDFARGTGELDRQVAERVRGLLPWSWRNAPVEER